MYIYIYIYIYRQRVKSKGDFPVSCAVTSFKIRNHYIVANLTVVVHSAEDC